MHECDTPSVASACALIQTKRKRDRVAPLFCLARRVIQKSERSKKLHLLFSLFLREWVSVNSLTSHGLPMAITLVWNQLTRPPEIVDKTISKEDAIAFVVEQFLS